MRDSRFDAHPQSLRGDADGRKVLRILKTHVIWALMQAKSVSANMGMQAGRNRKKMGYRQDTGFRVAMRECLTAGHSPKPMPAEHFLKCPPDRNDAETFVRTAGIPPATLFVISPHHV